jgi:hypothetical protein
MFMLGTYRSLIEVAVEGLMGGIGEGMWMTLRGWQSWVLI